MYIYSAVGSICEISNCVSEKGKNTKKVKINIKKSPCTGTTVWGTRGNVCCLKLCVLLELKT